MNLSALDSARQRDREDPLAPLRAQFLFPKRPDGRDALYFAGNSLGLQPKKARQYIEEELEDWQRLGVEGHVHGRRPWVAYHELVTAPMARVVGALPREVVVMNTLTVNLHLLMVSFYRPTRERHRILVEAGAFPSDQYAVASQLRFHGYSPTESLVELRPRAGEATLRPEDILASIEREGPGLALVLLGNVNYLTGQAFDVAAITRAAHAQGALVGFDLAHGAGNLELALHEAGPDFAVWCSYKYLNSGPGSLGGVFVHERHLGSTTLPRFAGWWGHDKASRFAMPGEFSPIPTAEAWQLSNPPIFQLAAMRASLELFDQATMVALRKKSVALTGLLEELVAQLPKGFCTQLTPRGPSARGAQLSLAIAKDPRGLVARLAREGVIADFREPNVVRFAPAPLYCRFEDVVELAEILRNHADA